MAASLSTLNTSGIHGPLPHTISNLLDILKSCIEAPDIEPHPTEGATEDEEEDTNYELSGIIISSLSKFTASSITLFIFPDRASQIKFVCQGSFDNNPDVSEDSTVYTFKKFQIFAFS